MYEESNSLLPIFEARLAYAQSLSVDKSMQTYGVYTKSNSKLPAGEATYISSLLGKGKGSLTKFPMGEDDKADHLIYIVQLQSITRAYIQCAV